MRNQGRQNAWLLLGLILLALGALLLTPFVGMHRLDLQTVLDPTASGIDSQVFWMIRVPRTCLAFLAGSALACSGMAFQAMFRNPLATPFTLGASSGASLGAALYVWLGGGFSVLGVSGVSLFAFLGAAASILVVWSLARLRGTLSTSTLLLAGVAVSFFFSSLILFLQYLSDFTQSFRILHWLMGGLEVMGLDTVIGVLPFVVAGTVIVGFLVDDLNLLTTGDDLAASRGVDIQRTKTLLFLAVSLMVGGVVAVCGPIGFVGMMAPHICRLLVGWNHRRLLPATLLFGGAFLTLCDAMARTVIAPAEIPVGIITALLGGPFFLWLLLTSSQLGGPRQ